MMMGNLLITRETLERALDILRDKNPQETIDLASLKLTSAEKRAAALLALKKLGIEL